MSQAFNIAYLPYHKIDKIKWDQCMDKAANGLIYGYSFYLDHMAKNWDALVLNDYESVMALTWNKKSGIYYLYQPPFTASLGVFGSKLNEAVINEFLQSIPKRFRLIEIAMNYQNLLNEQPSFLTLQNNFILPLNKSYEDLYRHYRENHQRNIQKALHAGCSVKKNIAVDEIISLSKEQMKGILFLKGTDYVRFKRLYEFLHDENKATSYGVLNAQNKLLASCVFFFSNKRAYYILAGNHPDSRNMGASHLLIDAFIKDHAGEDIILDFEGSDIESLALFYNGFGATREMYPAIRWNRLPWYLKWMKK